MRANLGPTCALPQARLSAPSEQRLLPQAAGGDASVPFRFDVHAIFFSEDAVSLESELHAHFSLRRVNWANDRKEFFVATPGEVRMALAEKLGNLLEFAEHVDSTEYLQSVRYWPTHAQPPEPSRATEQAGSQVR